MLILFFGLNGLCTVATYQKNQMSMHSSVTRFGDLLDFGQLFKAIGNN